MAQLDTTLKASIARANFYQILDDAANKLRQFTITIHGKARAVIMSAEEYEGWLETLDIISDPGLVADIKRGVVEIKSGKGIPHSQAKKILGW